jgi:transcriptional regulator with XRE-family HTH domain
MKSRIHKASSRVERITAWAKHRTYRSGQTRAAATDLTVPDRLRVARELSGLSRVQIAALLAIHTNGRKVYVTGGRPPPTFTSTMVAAIEAGETEPSADAMRTLAEIYEVPLEWLRGGPAPEWLNVLLLQTNEKETQR